MIRAIFTVWFLIIFSMCTLSYYAQTKLDGKGIFTTVKGPYGTCNTCHKDGGSAGRWDPEEKVVSADGTVKIPSLKGIGKSRTPEQLAKAIKLMKIKYKVPVTDSDMKPLVNYLSKL